MKRKPGNRVKYSKGKPPRWYGATGARFHRIGATAAAVAKLRAKRGAP